MPNFQCDLKYVEEKLCFTSQEKTSLNRGKIISFSTKLQKKLHDHLLSFNRHFASEDSIAQNYSEILQGIKE